MRKLTIRIGYWVLLTGAFVACSIEDGKRESLSGAIGGGGASAGEAGSAAGRMNAQGGRRASGGAAGSKALPSEAGARADAGAMPTEPAAGSQPMPQDAGPEAGPAEICDSDGGCPKHCNIASALCAVVTTATACEFEMAAGAAAEVACGETATAASSNCGGCGKVAVQVYFDGQYCWQGIPDCALPEFAGKFLLPHSP